MAEIVAPREALYAHLLADAAVKAAVGSRVYQRGVPLNSARPLVVIWPPISDVPRRDLDGVAYREARLQLTVMGATQRVVEQVMRAVRTAVEGHVGMMADSLDVILAWVDGDHQEEADTDEIHHHIDVMVRYRE